MDAFRRADWVRRRLPSSPTRCSYAQSWSPAATTSRYFRGRCCGSMQRTWIQGTADRPASREWPIALVTLKNRMTNPVCSFHHASTRDFQSAGSRSSVIELGGCNQGRVRRALSAFGAANVRGNTIGDRVGVSRDHKNVRLHRSSREQLPLRTRKQCVCTLHRGWLTPPRMIRTGISTAASIAPRAGNHRRWPNRGY
jgi:hypothetical protein